jgi:hypothetical protein
VIVKRAGVKILATICGGVFPERPRKNRTRLRREEKLGLFAMTFTGTLIEDLMATVERAEQRAQSDGALSVEASAVEPMFVESFVVESSVVGSLVVEPWFASVQENADYDPKFLGVA